MDWGRSNGLVVVFDMLARDRVVEFKFLLTSIVHEDGTEVTNNVDNEEDRSILALHREVAATRIAWHRLRLCEFMKALIDSLGGAKSITTCISRERESEEDDQQDDSVNVVGKESGLDTSEHGVDDDTEGKEETSRCSRNTSQGRDDGRASSEQHGGDENVGEETESDVHEVSGRSVAGADGFQECLHYCQK